MSTRESTSKPDDSESAEPEFEQSKRKLDSALNFLINLDPAAPMRGNLKLHLAVDEVINHSMNQGLEPRQITSLVDVIVDHNTKLSQAIRSKLVKCLIPSRKVPQATIIRALSFISSKIFISGGPSNLHSLLLRWILLVFDHIDGYDQLHKLYSVVFTFINSQRLLPHACHLLFLLTTKADVRLFRVQKLLGMLESLGHEPCILGLLMIYKVYCPHLVPMKLDSNHKVFFKAHDATWRSTITAVISQRKEADNLEAERKVTEVRSRSQMFRGQPQPKRQKLMLPESHTAAQEIEEEASCESLPGFGDKVPYLQIDTFTSFLEAIDRIEHPSQVAACLTDTRLQLLLACDPDPLLMARLCFWIQHIFAFGFRGTDRGGCERNERLLQILCAFSKNVQGLPVVLGFLSSFLPTWDGQTHAPLIFSLITSVRICSYNDLHCSILEPLQRIFFSSDVYIKTMCIGALTELLRNFALETKSRVVSQRDRTSSGDLPEPQSLGVEPEQQEQQAQNMRDVSRDQPGACERDALDTVHRLIKFLEGIFVVGMRMEDDHYLLQAGCLDLLQLVSEIHQKYAIPLVCLPLCLIHRLLLSGCPASLARLCGIINSFREAFISLKSVVVRQPSLALTCSTSDDFSSKNEFAGTEKFNALLLDVLGMLWQGRMFTDRKHKYESMFKFCLPSHLEGRLRDNALTVYTGPAFLGLAYKFLKETQREGKQVHPVQIETYKETYLQFLDREGFPEFMQLVNTNIKRRKNRS